MSARSVWNISESEFPAKGSDREKLGAALKYAALAPAESGWQPWFFRVEDSYLELIAKTDPTLDAADPDRRACLIGCGSALLYLRLALKHFGCLGRVALFPDLGQPTLVARVHSGSCQERSPQETFLFNAMTDSCSKDSPLGAMPVSETILTALSHAAAGERGWLDFVQSETSRQHLLKITLLDDRASQGMRPLFGFGGLAGNPWNMTVETVRHTSVQPATLAIVKTKTDDKHGWLEAGQTMARTVLLAQGLGLSWAFFNPVNRREAREALRMGIGHKGYAQVILRFDSLTLDGTMRQWLPDQKSVNITAS